MKRSFKDIIRKFLENIMYFSKYVLVYVILIFLPFILESIFKVYVSYSSDNLELKYGIELAIILSVFILLRIRSFNRDREFLNKGIYGNWPRFIYWFASCVLGYGLIDLAMKPYYVCFYILKNNLFNIKEIRLDEDNDNNITIDKGKYDKKCTICNVIIEDTYPINLEQIPERNRGLSTIKISRNEKECKRLYSKKFIDEIVKIFSSINKTNPEIHLYMTTNTLHTQKIVEDIFLKRENYNVYIHQQNSDDNRIFKEKGKHYIFD